MKDSFNNTHCLCFVSYYIIFLIRYLQQYYISNNRYYILRNPENDHGIRTRPNGTNDPGPTAQFDWPSAQNRIGARPLGAQPRLRRRGAGRAHQAREQVEQLEQPQTQTRVQQSHRRRTARGEPDSRRPLQDQRDPHDPQGPTLPGALRRRQGDHPSRHPHENAHGFRSDPTPLHKQVGD